MLLDKITQSEYEALDIYRNLYALEDKETPTVDMREVLRYWDAAKPNLFKLLGNNLIISKPVCIERSTEMMTKDRMTLCANSEFVGKFESAIWSKDEYENCRIVLNRLVNPHMLVLNKYDGPNKKITIKGKEIAIQTEAKIMKILSKVAHEMSLDVEFEEFRLKHSQILNQKHLKGDLTLSIHPLDYFTMSDNKSSWKSCMSWKDCGCYRRGTIEMMNSDYVIVAYLAASEPMMLDTYSTTKLEWSNKKWRSLFIANRMSITAVKGYPYNSSGINDLCFDWLRELAKENWGYEYYAEKAFFYNDQAFEFNDTMYYPDFSTEVMYNDFEDGDPHETLLSVDEYHNFGVNYSGACNCMCCGKTDVRFPGGEDSEGYLVCSECGNIHTCEYCGELVGEDEQTFMVDGQILCSECYRYETYTCIDDDEKHLYNNVFRHMLVDTIDNWGYRKIFYTISENIDEVLKPFVNENYKGVHTDYGWADYILLSELNDRGLNFIAGGYKAH